MASIEPQTSLLDVEHEGLKDAFDRVNKTRLFSRWTAVVFLGLIVAGGWHLYNLWFARSPRLGWVGVGRWERMSSYYSLVCPTCWDRSCDATTTSLPSIDVNGRQRML